MITQSTISVYSIYCTLNKSLPGLYKRQLEKVREYSAFTAFETYTRSGVNKDPLAQGLYHPPFNIKKACVYCTPLTTHSTSVKFWKNCLFSFVRDARMISLKPTLNINTCGGANGCEQTATCPPPPMKWLKGTSYIGLHEAKFINKWPMKY